MFYLGAAIPRGQFANWNNQPLNIPAIPPTIINSRVITVHYYVNIEVDVPWGIDPVVQIPVIMGTIPFRAVYNQQQQPPQQPPANQIGSKILLSISR